MRPLRVSYACLLALWPVCLPASLSGCLPAWLHPDRSVVEWSGAPRPVFQGRLAPKEDPSWGKRGKLGLSSRDSQEILKRFSRISWSTKRTIFVYLFTLFACFDSGLLISCWLFGCQYCFLLIKTLSWVSERGKLGLKSREFQELKLISLNFLNFLLFASIFPTSL